MDQTKTGLELATHEVTIVHRKEMMEVYEGASGSGESEKIGQFGDTIQAFSKQIRIYR